MGSNMPSQSNSVKVPAILLLLALTACSPRAVAAPAKLSPTDTLAPPNTYEPTDMPVPTPTLSLETLHFTAAPLCEAAFASPESTGSPEAPVFTLLNKEYEGQEWQRWGVQYYDAFSASEVRTLVCIRESRTATGTYTDFQSAYRLDWQVRLVRWPDGELLGATESALLGDEPPGRKYQPGPGYGESPRLPLLTWLSSAMGDRTLLVHGRTVSDLAFSPDGKTLATAADDRDSTVNLWDIATGQVVLILKGHGNSVRSIAFSPDGKTLATGSHDFTVKLWSTSTGQEVRTFEGHDGGVESVAFSPDGKTLASGGSDDTVVLWDVATGRKVRTLGDEGGVFTVAFAPDGRILLSGSGDTTVKLWDVASGKLLRTLSGHEGGVVTAGFSPDGKTLASGDWNGVVKVWDVATWELLRTLTGHQGTVSSVAFSPNGRILASGGDDAVRLWELTTGLEVRTIQGLSVSSVAFSPDGNTLASSYLDGTIKLWDVSSSP